MTQEEIFFVIGCAGVMIVSLAGWLWLLWKVWR